MQTLRTIAPNATLIASHESWIEGDALRQLAQTAALPGMQRVVGQPDLHPGKGHPIGIAALTEGCIYPHLVGNDIGCGMALWSTDLPAHKPKLDKWARRVRSMGDDWEGNAQARLEAAGLAVDDIAEFNDALGTVGGGNHFAELLRVTAVVDGAAFDLGLSTDRLCALVHSGSRGLGEAILRQHTDVRGAEPLADDSAECAAYLEAHDAAITWARVNRVVIAERLLDAVRGEGTRLLDRVHNHVVRRPEGWLHRKGAAPADEGPVLIPGSRGAISYLVQPAEDTTEFGWSLAHGAGRKWRRSECRPRLSRRFSPEDLRQTALGGHVICDDRDLLYEEAPQAYKDIERVVADLISVGACRILAVLSPVLTYKKAR
ncbi:MAG: RNA ligase RtcB family protein [Myxococcales bacterium]|nr:RNA ligase RtcB family protein [Myxococcales bacterium]